MALIFEITEGDRTGKRFSIRDRSTIGRKKAEIILRDSKVSGRHAQVERRGELYYLIDLKSSNGLKVDGKRVQEVLLLPGVKVQLGKTWLTVLEGDIGPVLSDAPRTREWTEELLILLDRIQAQFQKKPPETVTPRAFSPALQLKFIQGPQAGQTWTLGYGPRSIGSDALDLRIDEPLAPGLCFEVMPGATGVLFRTNENRVVLLNGAAKKADTLSAGDVIQIFETRIEVGFLKQ